MCTLLLLDYEHNKILCYSRLVVVNRETMCLKEVSNKIVSKLILLFPFKIFGSPSLQKLNCQYNSIIIIEVVERCNHVNRLIRRVLALLLSWSPLLFQSPPSSPPIIQVAIFRIRKKRKGQGRAGREHGGAERGRGDVWCSTPNGVARFMSGIKKLLILL